MIIKLYSMDLEPECIGMLVQIVFILTIIIYGHHCIYLR